MKIRSPFIFNSHDAKASDTLFHFLFLVAFLFQVLTSGRDNETFLEHNLLEVTSK